MNIRPMPLKFGVGFTSSEPVYEKDASWYRYERVGTYHNYHVKPDYWHWPWFDKRPQHDRDLMIDGFSPNLNKTLHIGHLRNLAIANSLQKILSAKFVALLGCSLGVKKAALDGWKHWTHLLAYQPTVYYDLALPDDIVPCRKEEDILLHSQGAQVWDGPSGPVIVKRTDGRPTYAFYDLAFASYVGPDYYITGDEQQEHFKSLGLGDKHLPMGLVLGPDSKKLKSRTGDAMTAEEVIGLLEEALAKEQRGKHHVDSWKYLAWNILAWNFLSATRERALKFVAENWTKPDQGGLYITYTYARSCAALGLDGRDDSPGPSASRACFDGDDLLLVGHAEQYHFYCNEASRRFDPSPLANFALELARHISQAYEKEPIKDGRPDFRRAFEHAVYRLDLTMANLGMFRLTNV